MISRCLLFVLIDHWYVGISMVCTYPNSVPSGSIVSPGDLLELALSQNCPSKRGVWVNGKVLR